MTSGRRRTSTRSARPPHARLDAAAPPGVCFAETRQRSPARGSAGHVPAPQRRHAIALTLPQLEQHLGRLLRQLITHMEPAVAQRVLEPLATGMLNAGQRYVVNGTLGTQPERREAMLAMAGAIYAALGHGDATDGARGQHGFEAHWLPAKQRGEG